MTQKELEQNESRFKELGYKKSKNAYMSGDYQWGKSVGKDDNPYEQNHYRYIIYLTVFDWRKYQDRDKTLHDASVDVIISVCRNSPEVPIALHYDIKDSPVVDIEDIEKKAEEFYKFVDSNFEVPKE